MKNWSKISALTLGLVMSPLIARAEITGFLTFPGGISTGSIQFNNDGIFSGTTNFYYSTGTKTLHVSSITASGSIVGNFYGDGSNLTGIIGSGGGSAGDNLTSSTMVWLNGGENISFQINSTTVAAIDSTGNMGIGTDAPTSRLDVFNGAVLIRGSGSGLTVGGLKVDTSGNVGIGTTNPDNYFHLYRGVSVGTKSIASIDSGPYAFLNINNNQAAFFKTGLRLLNNNSIRTQLTYDATLTGFGIDFSSSGVLGSESYRLFVKPNGLVGIGTVNPTNNLNVIGSGLFTSSLTATTIYGTSVSVSGGTMTINGLRLAWPTTLCGSGQLLKFDGTGIMYCTDDNNSGGGGGGGGNPLEVLLPGVLSSSPTMTVRIDTNVFSGAVNGSTITLSIPSSATLNVASVTASVFNGGSNFAPTLNSTYSLTFYVGGSTLVIGRSSITFNEVYLSSGSDRAFQLFLTTGQNLINQISSTALYGQDEGGFIGSGSTLNVTGAGASLAYSNGVLTLNVAGGGGGGGGGSLEVLFKTILQSSPTFTISFDTTVFTGSVNGSTANVKISPTANITVSTMNLSYLRGNSDYPGIISSTNPLTFYVGMSTFVLAKTSFTFNGVQFSDSGDCFQLDANSNYSTDFEVCGTTSSIFPEGIAVKLSTGDVAYQDEGTNLGAYHKTNFVGAGVTASNGGSGVLTVTIPGGGGGGSSNPLEVFLPGVLSSSPTTTIKIDTNVFSGAVNGTTITLSIPSSATLNVASVTASVFNGGSSFAPTLNSTYALTFYVGGSTMVLAASTITWNGAKVSTGDVLIQAAGVDVQGAYKLNFGTNLSVSNSGGIATINATGGAGGGGGNPLEVLFKTVLQSSPTYTISFDTTVFTGSVSGSTANVRVSPTANMTISTMNLSYLRSTSDYPGIISSTNPLTFYVNGSTMVLAQSSITFNSFILNDSGDCFQVDGNGNNFPDFEVCGTSSSVFPEGDAVKLSTGDIAYQDEGVALGTYHRTNFVGAGVTASNGGSGVLTVTIPGGGTETDPAFSAFTSTGYVAINSGVGFKEFQTTGYQMIGDGAGFNQFKSTGQTAINSGVGFSNFRSTGEAGASGGAAFNLFLTTGQARIIAAGGFTLFKSTGESGVAGGAAFALAQSTVNSRLNALDTIQSQHNVIISSNIAANSITGLHIRSGVVIGTHTNFDKDVLSIGSASARGTYVSSTGFVGVGSTLTFLNASNLALGTIPNERIDSSSVAKWGNSGLIEDFRIDPTSVTKQGAIVSSITGGSYDWYLMTNIPAGFADGVDNTGGVGGEADGNLAVQVATKPFFMGGFTINDVSSITAANGATGLKISSLTVEGTITTTSTVIAGNLQAWTTAYTPIEFPFAVVYATSVQRSTAAIGASHMMMEANLSTSSQDGAFSIMLPPGIDTNFDPTLMFAITSSTGVDPASHTFSISVASVGVPFAQSSGPALFTMVWQSTVVVQTSTTTGIASLTKEIKLPIPLTGWKTVAAGGARKLYIRVVNINIANSTCRRWFEGALIAWRRRT